MAISGKYGQMIPAYLLEDAVEQLIKDWIDEYLAEISAQWGRPVLPSFKAYGVRPTGDRWVEDQLPTCIVVSPGLANEPRSSSDGWLEADFRIGIAAFAMSTDERNLRRNLQDYAAVVRGILTQKKPSLAATGKGIWISESYESETDTETLRTYGGLISEFIFTVEGVVNTKKGPVQHGDTGDDPTVTTPALQIDVDVDRIPIP